MKTIRSITVICLCLLLLSSVVGCQNKNADVNAASSTGIVATDSPEAIEVARRFSEASLEGDTKTIAELTPDFMIRYLLNQYGVEPGESLQDSYCSLLDEQLAGFSEETSSETEKEVVSCELDAEYDLNAFYSDLSFYGLSEEEIASIEAYTPITVIIKMSGSEIKNSIVCGKINNMWYVLV